MTAVAAPAMGVDELAAELGRSTSWLYDHWRAEVDAGRLPPPLHNGAAPLVWSRAHVYATLDRPLKRDGRIAAAAWRAAAAAADNVRQSNGAAARVEIEREKLGRALQSRGKP